MFDTIGMVILVVLVVLLVLRISVGLYGYIFLDWTFSDAFGGDGDGDGGGGDGGD